MARAIRLIFDDREIAGPPTSDLVGARRFGDITLRRARLVERIAGIAAAMPVLQFRPVRSDSAYLDALRAAHDGGLACLVWRASALPRSDEGLRALLERLVLASQPVVVTAEQPLALFADDPRLILRGDSRPWDFDFSLQGFTTLDASHALIDVAIYRNCLWYLSSGFDARHFNAMEIGRDTVTKASSNVVKIEAEYTYYQLLPEAMKRWFISPYDLQVAEGRASYRMERLQVADVALQWTNASVGPRDFSVLLERALAFLDDRSRKPVAASTSEQVVDQLYVSKLDERIEALRRMPEFGKIVSWIACGTSFGSIDEVVARYRALYARHRPSLVSQAELAIGHGDLCFSNMLFDRHSALLKLIDPKGARSEAELWTHPSYDLAKLSHSILGDYDWINNGLYRLEISKEDRLELEILCGDLPLAGHKQAFVDELARRGIDPRVVRVCEASLFLSMLPLHIDRPNKVLALLLNAIDILEELEGNP